MPVDSILLPDPPERPLLEPFATAYIQVIVPEAVAGGWFKAMAEVPHSDLERITRRIESVIKQLLGHSVHPAVYVHALLVCGHFFYTAAQVLETPEELTTQADGAYSLVQHLILYHKLYDLYLILG